MTDLTPQQMREQAVVNEEFAEASEREGLITDMRLGRQNAAALRTAADQLEAVPEQLHDILGHIEMPEEVYVSLYAWYQRLTADTVAQGDRDE